MKLREKPTQSKSRLSADCFRMSNRTEAVKLSSASVADATSNTSLLLKADPGVVLGSHIAKDSNGVVP